MASNQPWISYKHIWKTEAAFLAWLRGGIRRSLWNKAPQKLEFIRKYREKIKNPNPKGKVAEVWGGTCALCSQVFPQTALQVDHKVGNNSLKSLDEIASFIKAIVLVTEDDLQFACKACHDAKSLAERQGLSFEEAQLQKLVIEISKKPVVEVKAWLVERGCSPASNAAARRKQIKEVLENEQGS